MHVYKKTIFHDLIDFPIGGALSGGGANRVLYEDSSQNLAANSNFTFDGTNFGISNSINTDFYGRIGTAGSGTDKNGLQIGVSANTGYSILSLKTMWGRAPGQGHFITCFNDTTDAFHVDSAGGIYSLEAAQFGNAGAAVNQNGHHFQWSPNATYYHSRFNHGFGIGTGPGDLIQFAFGGTVNGGIDSAGRLFLGGTSASAKAHVVSLTEQLRIAYDGSNYYSSTVGSSGIVTFDAVGSSAKFVFSDSVEGPINAYDATTWNGSAKFATEDAVRDKIEALIVGPGVSEEDVAAIAIALG